jgi:DNA repair exonuclease SbcCD ATPase subunit|nr:MAG TPA: Ead/Ea22-like protein [Caudoviricetes sp.]
MNNDITELTAKLKAAAQEEIMCREVCDTSDLWQDEASPENVLVLTEALEAAEKRIAQLESAHKFRKAWKQLAIKSISEREKDIAELTEARQRIAELEARTLTVKLPGAWCEPGNRWIQEADTIAAIKAACAAAGIKLKIKGE